MSQCNNREPRRFWKSLERNRARVPCASCGVEARPGSAHLPFCNACLDWARHDNTADGDELGNSD